jgi:hypothetical protein
VSRNLGTNVCYFCSGGVTLKEPPREIRPDEARAYIDEYAGMVVAKAECVDCEAKYLAWVKPAPGHGPTMHSEGPFFDLSFRSTFNDEYGPADVPTYAIETIRRRKGPWKDDRG